MSLVYPVIMAAGISVSLVWSLRGKRFLTHPRAAVALAGSVAALTVLAINFGKGYEFNVVRGYQGGIQARYYAAVIPVVLLGLVSGVEALANAFVLNAARLLLFAAAVESYWYFLGIAILGFGVP